MHQSHLCNKKKDGKKIVGKYLVNCGVAKKGFLLFWLIDISWSIDISYLNSTVEMFSTSQLNWKNRFVVSTCENSFPFAQMKEDFMLLLLTFKIWLYCTFTIFLKLLNNKIGFYVIRFNNCLYHIHLIIIIDCLDSNAGDARKLGYRGRMLGYRIFKKITLDPSLVLGFH